MKQMKYYIVDVFAEHKYEGNQLAVFKNAGHLSREQMQLIAKEINFQESTFIISEDKKQSTCVVRIFTPEVEMQFAGHPTIGTAWVMMNKLFSRHQDIVYLDLPVGKIKVEKIGDELWFTAAQPHFLGLWTIEDIKSFSNLETIDFNTGLPIQEVSTGSPFIIIPLSSEEALKNLIINPDALKNWISNHQNNHQFTAFYFWVPISKTQIKTRMLFIEHHNLREDAATGSACSCLLAYLLKYKEQNINLINYQGEYIGRPSVLKMKGLKENNDYTLQIGGQTQYIAKGKWSV